MIDIIGLLATLAFGLLTFFVRKKITKKTKKTEEEPPKNTVADAALDDVQESLEEEIDRIKSATNGDSPADDLADLGNARKRR